MFLPLELTLCPVHTSLAVAWDLYPRKSVSGTEPLAKPSRPQRLKDRIVRQFKKKPKVAAGASTIERRPISDWINGKAFSLIHKSNLVYNTCWEDPRLDRVALELGKEDTIVVITSAGCNALDYALDEPKAIFAVDMNPRQNALLELKIAAIRELDYETFWQLFGEGHLEGFRRVYGKKLRKHLSPKSLKFWDKRTHFFDSKRSFYFRGSSGSVARFINYYIDKVLKIRPVIDEMLAAQTLEEQKRIYDEQLRDAFWTGFMKKFVGSQATLSMLGVPRPQLQQLEYHYGKGISEFIEQALEAVFTKLPFQDNYFWRVYLTGQYTPEACPNYLVRENFDKLKGGLVEKVTAHTMTIEGFLRETSTPISRFILLDHMDWLSTYQYQALESEWQAIVNRSREDARILFRSGGVRVDFVDPIEVSLRGKSRRLGDLLTYNRELADELHEKDRVHTYGSFHIADLKTD